MPQETSVAPAIVGFCSAVQLNNCVQVDDFFQDQKAQHYVEWFNATLADQGSWAGVRLVDSPSNDIGFHRFWNRINQIFGGTINLLQFVSLMSILSNEVRGDFTPQSERMGSAGHPGLAYLFDRIEGMKRCYNTLEGNQTALECFNNEDYISVHGGMAGATEFARTSDTRWSGEAWPEGVSTGPDPAVSGFLIEADFMKFRGRGFIQTTGRANYAPLIDFAQNYSGDNATISFFRSRWSGFASDRVAFESTNADWDTLFQQTDLIVAAEAVRVHNVRSGGYLALSTDAAVLNGEGKGSLFFMGLRISGSTAYANKFRDRVGAVLSAIGA